MRRFLQLLSALSLATVFSCSARAPSGGSGNGDGDDPTGDGDGSGGSSSESTGGSGTGGSGTGGSGTGGSGTGGSGTGGSGTGGSDVGTGGADPSTGGADVGTGGADLGTGGADPGTGGAPTGPVGQIGLFSAPEDIFCPHFDTLPDLDDVHAQAAIASVVAHPDIAGIDVFAVVGAYGNQDGVFVESFGVMDLGFPGNWTSTTGAGYSWETASDASSARMVAALQRGGDVWIAEAGQSDFSYDAIQKAIAAMPGVDTQRFHIVQHSEFNESVTTQSDLQWLRDNIDYIHVQDGNFPNNGTPDFKTFPEEITPADAALWAQVTSHPTLGALWTEAKRVADEKNPDSVYNNTAIEAGGFDFSDTVEATHIFGFNGSIDDHVDFFSTFVP